MRDVRRTFWLPDRAVVRGGATGAIAPGIFEKVGLSPMKNLGFDDVIGADRLIKIYRHFRLILITFANSSKLP